MAKQQLLTQLLLPWFTPDGELHYSAMTLTNEGLIGRNTAYSIMREWYKEQIGIEVDNLTLKKIWNRKHVTRAMSELQIQKHLHNLAVETYAEAEKITNSELQEGAPSETGV